MGLVLVMVICDILGVWETLASICSLRRGEMGINWGEISKFCSDESRNWFCSVGSENEEFVVLLVRMELVGVAISGDSCCGIDPNAAMIARSTVRV